MRLFFVGVVLLFCTTSGVAQQPSRWTLSAGPEWTRTFVGSKLGGRLRAEYDLVAPTSPLRLRAEAGTFWSPTQSFWGTYIDGSTVQGFNQTVDLTFGFSAAIAPLPRARFSPYIMMGAYARQAWSHGTSSFRDSNGNLVSINPEGSRTVGDVLFQAGIGIRARIGGRMFQLELRHFDHRALTFGTSLPF